MKKNLAITLAIAIIAIFAIVACSNSVVVKKTVATPVIYPNGGDITTATAISLSSTVGATIYYTLDGTAPTEEAILYEDHPFTLDKSCTVKAKAFLEGSESSDCARADFSIVAPKSEKNSIDILGGKFIVHFEEAQEVENHYLSYTDTKDSIVIVSYDTCTTAYPVIKDLPASAALKDWIDVLSLVSVEEGNNNDFALAITTHGGLLKFIRAICAQILNIAEADITIVINSDGDLVISTTTSPSDLFVELARLISSLINLVPSVDAKLGIHLTNNWDGLALSPIYLTEDLYGLLLDILYGNVSFNRKSLAPLSNFGVYYNNGKTVAESDFTKVSANLEYYYDGRGSDTAYFAKEFVTKDKYKDFPKDTQIFDGEKCKIITCTYVTDTDYGYGIIRHYYIEEDCIAGDNKILISATDFSTNTDTDWVTRDSTTKYISFVPIVEEPLEEDVTYTILTKGKMFQGHKLFAVDRENSKIENFGRNYDIYGSVFVKLVMAKSSNKNTITGFKAFEQQGIN